MGSILPDDLERAIIFKPGEKPLAFMQAYYRQLRLPRTQDGKDVEHFGGIRPFILTNHRLILYTGGRMKSLFGKKMVPFAIADSLEYESIIGMGVFNELFDEWIAIQFRKNGWESVAHLSKIRVLNNNSEVVEETTPNIMIERFNSFMKDRQQQIEDEKRRSNIQIIIDFQFLKGIMEKGGVVVCQIKCPSCGSSISIPQTGVNGKCDYCGQVYYAQDVFEKLRWLIKQ